MHSDLRHAIDVAIPVGVRPDTARLLRRGRRHRRRVIAAVVLAGLLTAAAAGGAIAAIAVDWGSPSHLDTLARCVREQGHTVRVFPEDGRIDTFDPAADAALDACQQKLVDDGTIATPTVPAWEYEKDAKINDCLAHEGFPTYATPDEWWFWERISSDAEAWCSREVEVD